MCSLILGWLLVKLGKLCEWATFKNVFTKCLFPSFSLKGNIKSLKKKKILYTTQTKILSRARVVSFISDSSTSSQGIIYIILISKSNWHQLKKQQSPCFASIWAYTFSGHLLSKKVANSNKRWENCKSDGVFHPLGGELMIRDSGKVSDG